MLPEPLVTKKVNNQLENMRKAAIQGKSMLAVILSYVKEIPPNRLYLLKFVCSFLKDTLTFSMFNKMNEENLAISKFFLPIPLLKLFSSFWTNFLSCCCK